MLTVTSVFYQDGYAVFLSAFFSSLKNLCSSRPTIIVLARVFWSHAFLVTYFPHLVIYTGAMGKDLFCCCSCTVELPPTEGQGGLSFAVLLKQAKIFLFRQAFPQACLRKRVFISLPEWHF